MTVPAAPAPGPEPRVTVDAGALRRRIEAAVAPVAAASLRDDPVANHPLVREASALFDATIVRIEAAGSLPEPGPAAAGGLADALEPGANGDADV